MAIDAERRHHALRTMLVAGALGFPLMGVQCNTGVRPPPPPPPPVRDAAADFQTAVKLIGTRVGLNAKKVEDDFRRVNPGLTEDDLADLAENAADVWEVMDDLAKQAEQETRLVIARSTCYWLTATGSSDETDNEKLQTFIKSQPAVARLADPDAKVAEVINGIKAQLGRMRARGVTDTDAMAEDAACWLFQPF